MALRKISNLEAPAVKSETKNEIHGMIRFVSFVLIVWGLYHQITCFMFKNTRTNVSMETEFVPEILGLFLDYVLLKHSSKCEEIHLILSLGWKLCLKLESLF